MILNGKIAVVTGASSGMGKAIATIAVFLANEDSSFVNGVALAADGGWIAY